MDEYDNDLSMDDDHMNVGDWMKEELDDTPSDGIPIELCSDHPADCLSP